MHKISVLKKIFIINNSTDVLSCKTCGINR